MPRFANMLRQAYIEKGHEVEVWAPWPKLHSLLPNCGLSKWLGYIDQYIIFPFWVRKQLKTKPANTLYVFCDQALGPWVPLVKNKPHIVHVHDLLALRSALGDIKENPTSLSGQIYQRYIRHGFRQAKRFISVSNKTRQDLHSFGQVSAANSEVVYNGLNYPFSPLSSIDAIRTLNDAGLHAPAENEAPAPPAPPLPGTVVQPDDPEHPDDAGAVLRPYRDAVRLRRALRRSGRGDRGVGGDRRVGWADRPPAQGDVALRC